MKIDFSKATLVTLFEYLENLEYEASILNINTTDLLEKEKVSHKMSKELFQILSNTLIQIKNGDMTINGNKTSIYEKSAESNKIVYAVPYDEAIKMTNPKDFGIWLDNLTNWEIDSFNLEGTHFVSTGKGDTFTYNVSSGTLTVNNYSYKIGKDFNYVLYYNDNIYLFYKNINGLDGVCMIRYSIEELS